MWSSALLTALDEVAPGHRFTRQQLSAQIRGGFPWHSPDVPHPELCDGEAWWRAIADVAYEASIRAGVPREPARAAADRLRTAYTDLTTWQLYDDSIWALAELAADGWRHALVSNHVPELRLILSHLGIGDMFDVISNSAETGYEKPHADAFQTALSHVGPVDEVWMIGDNPVADIAGAAALGIPGIQVRKSPPDGSAALSLKDVVQRLRAVGRSTTAGDVGRRPTGSGRVS
jgi:putative hydrolase of the HAD superfamily